MGYPILENIEGKTIGLLGGSFNPAHEGHLHISMEALKTLKVDQIWWLISPGNPLKENKALPSVKERIMLAKKVIGSEPIKVSDFEEKNETIYTIDTLKALFTKHPKTKFLWLMGEDNMIQIPKWKEWKAFIGALPIAVFKRDGYSKDAREGQMAKAFKAGMVSSDNIGSLKNCAPPAWGFVPNEAIKASSTEIREKALKND